MRFLATFAAVSCIPRSLAIPFPSVSSLQVVTVTQTVAATATITQHVTQTDHTTQTDVVLETAYIVDAGAGCSLSVATGSPVTYALEPLPTAVSATSSGGSGNSDDSWSSGPTLYPTVPPTINTDDISHLTPSYNGSYYMTENTTVDTSIEHLFAETNMTFQYPAVILPHSSHVYSISCLSNGIAVTFSNTTVYQFVQHNWSVGTTGFLLITPSLGCTETNLDQGFWTYWLVSAISFDDATMTVSVVAVEIATENALNQVSIIWGTNQVPSSSSNTSTSTNPDYSSNTCANPPASYMGLPTAPCGSNFDMTLDTKIGFFSSDDNATQAVIDSEWASFDPDPDFDGIAERPEVPSDEFPDRRRRGISNRGTIVTKTTAARRERLSKAKCAKGDKAACRAVANPQTLGDVTATVAKDLGNGIVTGVKKGIEFLRNPKFDKTFPINVPYLPPILTIYNATTTKKNGLAGTVALTCENCVIGGSARVQGAVDYSIVPPSLTKAEVDLSGSIMAGVNLHLHAEGTYSQQYKKNIFNFVIPNAGLHIGDLLIVGVTLTGDAVASFNISAEADVYAGANIKADSFTAKINLLDRSKSDLSNFNPTFDRSFNVTGLAKVSAGLSLPFEVGVGLEVPLVKSIGRRKLGLVNTPEIVASANITGSYGVTGSTNLTSAKIPTKRADYCDNSIGLSLVARDQVDFDLGGTMYKITAFEKNLYSKCIPFSSIFGGEQQNSTTNSTAPAKTTNSKRFNFQLRQDSTAYDDNITDEYLNSTTLDAGDETAEDLLLSSEEDQLITNATATPLAAGDLYGTIYDVSGAYVLSSGTDNNFFLDDAANAAAATQFIFSNYVTNEDEDGDIFFYYPDEMNILGVSRFRSANDSFIPMTSEIIDLVPYDSDNSTTTGGIFIPINGNDTAFYTALCDFADLPSKIFLVEDPVKGLETLKKTELEYVVTGGTVTDCSLFGLRSSYSGYEA